jgi:hypothetical protein
LSLEKQASLGKFGACRLIDRNLQESGLVLPGYAQQSLAFKSFSINYLFETGFFCKNTDLLQ